MMMGKPIAKSPAEKAVQTPHPSWGMDWFTHRAGTGGKQGQDSSSTGGKEASHPKASPVSMGQVLGIALFLSGSQWHDTHKIFGRRLPTMVTKFLNQADRLTLERCVVEAMARLNQADIPPTASPRRGTRNKRKKA